MRKTRNDRISLESRLSLDQSYEDSNEAVVQRYFKKQGDFTKGVILWSFIEKMGEHKCHMLRLMNHSYAHHEIMRRCQLDVAEYSELLAEIQEAFREWTLI